MRVRARARASVCLRLCESLRSCLSVRARDSMRARLSVSVCVWCLRVCESVPARVHVRELRPVASTNRRPRHRRLIQMSCATKIQKEH